MENLLKYSGIVTKIRAMEAKLLTPEQFADIANLRSVPDIADYLRKNTAYAEVLDTLTEDQIHRGNIEKVLVQSLYHDYTKIYRFCGQSQREFMKLIMKGYEIELINYCLRIVINQHHRVAISNQIMHHSIQTIDVGWVQTDRWLIQYV